MKTRFSIGRCCCDVPCGDCCISTPTQIDVTFPSGFVGSTEDYCDVAAYLDGQTFSLTDDGSGFTIQACAGSGNSNLTSVPVNGDCGFEFSDLFTCDITVDFVDYTVQVAIDMGILLYDDGGQCKAEFYMRIIESGTPFGLGNNPCQNLRYSVNITSSEDCANGNWTLSLTEDDGCFVPFSTCSLLTTVPATISAVAVPP